MLKIKQVIKISRLKNTMDWILNIDPDELDGWKMTLFFFVIIG